MPNSLGALFAMCVCTRSHVHIERERKRERGVNEQGRRGCHRGSIKLGRAATGVSSHCSKRHKYVISFLRKEANEQLTLFTGANEKKKNGELSKCCSRRRLDTSLPLLRVINSHDIRLSRNKDGFGNKMFSGPRSGRWLGVSEIPPIFPLSHSFLTARQLLGRACAELFHSLPLHRAHRRRRRHHSNKLRSINAMPQNAPDIAPAVRRSNRRCRVSSVMSSDLRGISRNFSRGRSNSPFLTFPSPASRALRCIGYAGDRRFVSPTLSREMSAPILAFSHR